MDQSTSTSIAWDNLTVSVRSFLAKNEKVVLNQISGSFVFNSINALMGSSGSGKTTLRKCFIYQNHEQRVMTGLTVRQALIYASKLKNSGERDVNHNEIVSQVMSELLIADIENSRIENCSGGQIKRVSVALELTGLIKPNLLFLDEPTTGLDSNAAETVSLQSFVFKIKN